MGLYQITLFVTFVFLILGYSYALITPALLIGYTPIIDYVKLLAQTFFTIVLVKGFKTKFKLAESKQNITQLINENPDKIDILVCNHTSSLDFLIIMSYLQEFQIEIFNFVLKSDIIYTPGFGFIMYGSSDVKLNRNWEQDKETLGKQLDKIKFTGKKQVILIFPEGTRLTETKLKEGQEFSKKNSLPVFSNLMVPKSKGLWFIINHLAQTNKLGKIWDISLIFPKYLKKSIGFTNILAEPIGDVNVIWRHVELTKNYSNQNEFKAWLINLWITKDSLIKHYDKIIYKEIFPHTKAKTSTKLLTIIISVLIIGLLLNKYGRNYMLVSLLLSYVLIIFRL